MAIVDPKSLPPMQLTFEFLRLVIIELKGRRFENEEPGPPLKGEAVLTDTGIEDVLKVLPEITREFAAKIKPEFTRCYRLLPIPAIDNQYIAHDPISGVTIRCARFWDTRRSEIRYRFEAAFS